MANLLSSVVEYNDRGPWGDPNFAGNTTGHIVKDLIDTYRPKTVLDPMEGSGTSRSVCRLEFPDITYFGYDLSNGHDLMDPKTQVQIEMEVFGHPTVAENMRGGADLIFWHPPYWRMYEYHLGDKRDLSTGPYILYLTRMQQLLKFLRKMLNVSGELPRLAMLIGDYRQAGKYYWLVRDLLEQKKLRDAQFELDAIIIKKQRSVTSSRKRYPSNKPLIRIMHEYVAVLRPTIR
jgi:hypothetical protein